MQPTYISSFNMQQKPTIPKGTRDFSPLKITQRTYIFEILKKNFEKFGCMPIETPCLENMTTLMGKYGEEGDLLLFKILDSGDYLSKIHLENLKTKNSKALAKEICSKALRYDLTVPFARYIAQHQNEIIFPFKRYQIGPVWRADSPQKGRFREFYQCDADVVGSDSLWQEVDFVQLYDSVFSDLKLKNACLKINHRKILAGIAELIEVKDKLLDFTVALDKLEKIGKKGVKKEMQSKGIPKKSIEKMETLFDLKGENVEKLNFLEELLKNTASGKKGCQELQFILKHTKNIGLKNLEVDFEITLARGLNYYTGAIFEVAAPKEFEIGSIGGGGRYDDLTKNFGLKNSTSGVGISFGVDRIFWILEQTNLLPKQEKNTLQILIIHFEETANYCMKILKTLREHNISCELYPEAAKLKKQFRYADKKQMQYVLMIGSEEMEQEIFTLKNMKNGTQKKCNKKELMKILNLS